MKSNRIVFWSEILTFTLVVLIACLILINYFYVKNYNVPLNDQETAHYIESPVLDISQEDEASIRMDLEKGELFVISNPTQYALPGELKIGVGIKNYMSQPVLYELRMEHVSTKYFEDGQANPDTWIKGTELISLESNEGYLTSVNLDIPVNAPKGEYTFFLTACYKGKEKQDPLCKGEFRNRYGTTKKINVLI